VFLLHLPVTHKVLLRYASYCCASLFPLFNSKKKRPKSTAPASHRLQCIPFEDSVPGNILTVFCALKIINVSWQISADEVICDLKAQAVCRRVCTVEDFLCTSCKETDFSSSYFGFPQSLVFHQCPVHGTSLLFSVSYKIFATNRFLKTKICFINSVIRRILSLKIPL
jgi:hypothetical protein